MAASSRSSLGTISTCSSHRTTLKLQHIPCNGAAAHTVKLQHTSVQLKMFHCTCLLTWCKCGLCTPQIKAARRHMFHGKIWEHTLTRKSKISVLVMAAAMSFLCSVRRLFSSEWFQDLSVSSRMNISHACLQAQDISSETLQKMLSWSSCSALYRGGCIHLCKQHRSLSTNHSHILI